MPELDDQQVFALFDQCEAACEKALERILIRPVNPDYLAVQWFEDGEREAHFRYVTRTGGSGDEESERLERSPTLGDRETSG
jgi:hypothetical protein